MATPTVYRRAFYVVATDEDAFERCCHDVSEAIRHSSAVELEHDNFAQGVPEAEDMLAEHALVAMQSNDCQSYSEDSLLMMNMMTKFKLVTSKYMKMSSEMQSILWKYLPQQVEEFSVVDAPMYQVANGRVGNYEALEMIGHGKFGQIISCRDLNTDRHIVLKKMSKSFVKSISTLKRVTTEIKLLRNASNAVEMANLLPIEEVFQTNSHFYYTMARYGQDVFEFMKLGNHSTLGAGFENSVIIFAHVCEALSFMHGHGCAHRDIKSENVLVEYDPMPNGLFLITGVKVIDLGLACAVNDEMTRREVSYAMTHTKRPPCITPPTPPTVVRVAWIYGTRGHRPDGGATNTLGLVVASMPGARDHFGSNMVHRGLVRIFQSCPANGRGRC
mmetsp:Transcript_43065/g.116192  ORF Transcript_43065/g.116192 Transcript_43065/m.116192 type:complete len:388 (-) Transcript_43065:471-1634(-)